MAPRNKPSTQDTTAVATGENVSAELSIVDGFTEDALRSIASFDDAAQLLYNNNVGIVDAASVLGDGFALLKEERKSILIGVPLLVLGWKFYPGEYGEEFVALRLVARNPDGSAGKYILTDGSTGIAETLKNYTARTGSRSGLMVRNGLRASSYIYCEACERTLAANETDDEHKAAKKHKPATTYYLDTSA